MKTPISKCCNYPVATGGEGTTHYHVCTNCSEPADVRPDPVSDEAPKAPRSEFQALEKLIDEMQDERDRLQRELDAMICSGNLEYAAKVARARQQELDALTAELSGTKACLLLLLDAVVLGASRLKAWQGCAKELRVCLTGNYTGKEYWAQREQAIAKFDQLEESK